MRCTAYEPEEKNENEERPVLPKPPRLTEPNLVEEACE
jgi:hypothetical protein